jgi:hypothetical protein
MTLKMNNFIVTGFVTQDTPYELLLSQHLLPSLEKLNLSHSIDVIENEGSWLKNVAQKPNVVLRAMEKYPAYDIVVLDADSEVLTYPELFLSIPKEFDFACHILDWNSWYQNNSNVKEVLSGTLWVRNTPKAKELVTKWRDLATSSFEWEQKCLQKAIEELNFPVYNLPIEYCYISTLPDGSEPHVKCDPVIVHKQASRKYKKLIR